MKPQEFIDNLQKISPQSIKDKSYRFFGATKKPTDTGLAGGRYNPPGRFGALYTAKTRQICLAELYRKTVGKKLKKKLKISMMRLKLQKVLDLTDPKVLKTLNITEQQLIDKGWSFTQFIGNCAHDLGYEALIAPSATQQGDNIIVFTDNISEGSSISVSKTEDLN